MKGFRKLKKLVLALAVTMSAIVSFGTKMTDVKADFSGYSGSYGALYDAAAKYIGNHYSYSRFGPGYGDGGFDCSGLIDRAAHEAGIYSTPWNDSWITNHWCSYLDGLSGVEKIDCMQDDVPSKTVNKGDIIMFYNSSSRTPSSSYHMGVMLHSNAMLSAIYTGVKVCNLVDNYADSYTTYVAGNKGGQEYVRIYHFPSTKKLTVNLFKTSADATITTGDDSYSLEGAVYEVWDNDHAIGKITTDAKGKASWTGTVSAGTSKLWVREIEAPKGFELDSSWVEINYASSLSKDVTVQDRPQTKSVCAQLNKTSANTEITVGNSCYSLEGAVYAVYDGDTMLGTITTDTEGRGSLTIEKARLGLGTLTFVETKAPKGYELDEEPITVAIGDDGTAEAAVEEIPGNDPLVITLEKVSEDPVENPVSLAGAQFTLKYYDAQYAVIEEISSAEPLRTWVIQTKLNEDTGKYEAMLEDSYLVSGDDFYRDSNGFPVLPLGTLSIEETRAPEGYTLENKVLYELNGETYEYEETSDGIALFHITMDGDGIAAVKGGNHFTISESVSRGGLRVQKYDAGTHSAEFQGNAEDLTTVFEIVNLNEYDVMARDMNGSALGSASKGNVVTAISTNESGYYESSSNFLPLGTYLLRERTAPAGYTLNGVTEAQFVIAENGGYAELLNHIYDDPVRSGFMIRKNISNIQIPEGADLTTSFTIINRSENPVFVNDTLFAENEEILSFSTDKNGYYESAADLLPYGRYEIRETKAPAGTALAGTVTAEFEVNENNTLVDLTEVITDEFITGTLNITKTLETISADKNAVEFNDLSGIEFTLRASEDIRHPLTGDIVMEKGSTAVDTAGRDAGVLVTDAEGNAAAADLYPGRYYLQESEVPAGMVLSDEVYDVVFQSGDDPSVSRLAVNLTITNSATVTEISKKALTGDDELEGAQLSVIDKNGETVDSWTSGKKAHVIQGLADHETYILREEAAPDGYYYAEEAEFTVNGGEVQKIAMMDHLIRYRIAKVDDIDGSYVKGVQLKLTDITDASRPYDVELPNGGITGDEPFELNGKLIAGHTYVLEESEYVAGVYKAENLTFTVNRYGTDEVTTITMMDTTAAVSVSKTDNHGSPVTGAVLQIISADGEVVFTFVSGSEPEDISAYVKGDQEYILHESKTPEGFETMEDISFIVNGTQNAHQCITAVNVRKSYRITVLKTENGENGKHLSGAEMALFAADGTIAKDVTGKECKGITDEKGYISWLVEFNDDQNSGGYYVLETKAPSGYRLSKQKYSVMFSDAEDGPAPEVLVRVANEKVPETGIGFNKNWAIASASAMFAAVIFFVLKRRII